jgi:cobalt-precorrin 5A hydrolase
VRGAVFAFTERGKATARRVADHLDGEIDLYAPTRLAGEGFNAYKGSLPGFVGGLFDREVLIFVGAAGIALRAVAPYVASKKSDPAVLCMDEAARYVIPLLSGHIGGANALARRLAAALDATPVVTTATDVNGRFSVDTWATEHGMAITSMPLAKRVSAEILARDVPFYTDGERPGTLANGLIWGDGGALGICVSVHDLKPFDDTLLLVPRALRVGIGCRRGTPAAAIEAAVRGALSENNLRPEAVAEAATIDVKSDEAGLIECCRSRGWPLKIYTAAQLNAVPGSFTKSEFVKHTVGVDNVCERAAAASGGAIIVKKTAVNGVTVAVAEVKWGIEFG